jgi:hypothetical protein
VRYFEFVDEEPYVYLLSEHRTNVSTKGADMLPKRAMAPLKCEVARMLKLTGDAVEPISFIVPRKSEAFQVRSASAGAARTRAGGAAPCSCALEARPDAYLRPPRCLSPPSPPPCPSHPLFLPRAGGHLPGGVRGQAGAVGGRVVRRQDGGGAWRGGTGRVGRSPAVLPVCAEPLCRGARGRGCRRRATHLPPALSPPPPPAPPQPKRVTMDPAKNGGSASAGASSFKPAPVAAPAPAPAASPAASSSVSASSSGSAEARAAAAEATVAALQAKVASLTLALEEAKAKIAEMEAKTGAAAGALKAAGL